MITQLTKAQEARLPEFIKKWTDIGLSTEPANRIEAEKGIIAAYKSVGLEAPKIVWCDSPLTQGLTKAIVFGLLESQAKGRQSVRTSLGQLVAQSVRYRERVGQSAGQSVWPSVKLPIAQSVWESVWQSVRQSAGPAAGQSVWQLVVQSPGPSVEQSVVKSVRQSVEQSVKQPVAQSVWKSFWQSAGQPVAPSAWQLLLQSRGRSFVELVGQLVRQSVVQSARQSVEQSVEQSRGESVRQWVLRQSVGHSVELSVEESVEQSGYGQHDASWLGYYDYCKTVCGLGEETYKLGGLWQIAQNAGWLLPFNKLCWVSERHCKLHRNPDGQLHNDEEMALAYPDGWGIYALNGVLMQPEHVLTRAEDLDPGLILSETNVDIRRELLRKIGIERFLVKAEHQTLDKVGNYELLSIELLGIKGAKFLKMLNPSMGVWHVEGVHPSCQTVEHAINWRATGNINKSWNPHTLT